jgi:hypothetical protein
VPVRRDELSAPRTVVQILVSAASTLVSRLFVLRLLKAPHIETRLVSMREPRVSAFRPDWLFSRHTHSDSP